MAVSEDRAYFSNLLTQLDLRIFACLGQCPADQREAAHDWVVSLSDHSMQDDFLPDDDELSAWQRLTAAAQAEHDAMLGKAAEAGDLPAIEQLRDRFSLSAEEFFLLTAVLAPSADRRFGQIYRAFQGSEEPRMDFLLSLLEPDGLHKYKNAPLLEKDGRLLSCGLLSTGNENPTASTVFRPAPGILEWLNGQHSAAFYDGRAEWTEKPEPRVHADHTSIVQAVRLAEISGETVPLICFYGPDEEQLLDHAESLAEELARPMLRIDLSDLSLQDALSYLRIAMRDAVLNQAVPVVSGISGWFETGGVLPAAAGNLLNNWNLAAVMITDRPIVFPQGKRGSERLVLRIAVNRLSGSQRFHVWKQMLENLSLDDSVTDEALRTLAGQFSMSASQIRAAVSAALGDAVIEDRDLRVEDLYEGARVSSMHHLSDLAKKMPAKYTLRDLVLPDKQKREIDKLIAMARNRSQVLEDWGVGQKLVSGRGISALFTGVPGTGKTLSAQVIAGELGLELYRVDLSTIVSKYIGETEKNLERIFTEAQSSNVILFFDEADSLFGRRSEVNDSHDRYANIEVGYLLQRIETYDGIVLMATNLGANLDEAFTRRINFIIDFPFPDEETRLRLWQLLLPENIEKEPDIDLVPFASAYKIAGGSIRNAVVWAIYESADSKRPLSRADLLHGVEREYQKMGKVFISIG